MQTLLVSTKEIAVRYSAHPQTVLKWVRAKVLPVVRINKRCIRFNVEVLQQGHESPHVGRQKLESRLKRFGVWQRDGYDKLTRDKIPDS